MALLNFMDARQLKVIEDASLIYRRIHPDDIEIMRVAELKAIHNMSNYVVEVRVINPDGSIRWAYSIRPRIIVVDWFAGME
jgi:hypothetical protein